MALINCPECNMQISDSASSCPHCGAPLKPAQQVVSNPQADQVCPETHLTKAILVTIFCCWPLGIPAIVNAASVSSAFLTGHYDVALEKSQKANQWCKYTIIAGVVFWVFYIALIVALGVMGALEA